MKDLQVILKKCIFAAILPKTTKSYVVGTASGNEHVVGTVSGNEQKKKAMLLELHQVTIGEAVRNVSLTVSSGQMLTLAGPQDTGAGSQETGRTTLLRAVLGFIPLDGGHISIDGELLTPKSAPWFRKKTAYVPKQLSVPEGYKKVGDGRWTEMTAGERYLWLLQKAVRSDKTLLIVDEPPTALSPDDQQQANALLQEATARGATVLAAISTNGNISLTP